MGSRLACEVIRTPCQAPPADPRPSVRRDNRHGSTGPRLPRPRHARSTVGVSWRAPAETAPTVGRRGYPRRRSQPARPCWYQSTPAGRSWRRYRWQAAAVTAVTVHFPPATSRGYQRRVAPAATANGSMVSMSSGRVLGVIPAVVAHYRARKNSTTHAQHESARPTHRQRHTRPSCTERTRHAIEKLHNTAVSNLNRITPPAVGAAIHKRQHIRTRRDVPRL